jgi:hypothetical protein
MSEFRPDPRVNTDLSVRVWGMAANGQTFSQHVRARNISVSGALFSGLENELKVGDVIGVQYGDRKSRCRVVWVMDAGPVQKMQVGVQIVTDQDCPWKSELRPDQITPPAEPSNRRRFARHRISFPGIARRARKDSHARECDGCQRKRLLRGNHPATCIGNHIAR